MCTCEMCHCIGGTEVFFDGRCHVLCEDCMSAVKQRIMKQFNAQLAAVCGRRESPQDPPSGPSVEPRTRET